MYIVLICVLIIPNSEVYCLCLGYSPCLIWSVCCPGSASGPLSWSVPPAPPSSALRYSWRGGREPRTSCRRTNRWWTKRVSGRTASVYKPTTGTSEIKPMKTTYLHSSSHRSPSRTREASRFGVHVKCARNFIVKTNIKRKQNKKNRGSLKIV